MRASDADRDAVVSDLSQHFQAGRLTVGELDERTGRALAARTWGELAELVADLPAASSGQPPPASRRVAPPLIPVLAGLGIAAVVLMALTHTGWGLIWLLWPVLIITRRLASRHCGQPD